MKALLLILILMLVIGVAAAQNAAVRSQEPQAFSKVTRVGDDSLRSFFMFTVSGHDYTIRADGFGERSFEKARARNFNLKVDQRRIQQVYFLEHDSDLLLIYQLSDEHLVRGYVVRLDQTTLKPLWQTAVSDLELDSAFAQGDYLKLKAPNAVVKMDLKSGTLVEN